MKKKTITQLKKKLWEECKRITRARCVTHEGTWVCYTCDKTITEPQAAHTGHFISSSIASVHLRYYLDNLRVQCYNCNINKSGNWVAFEKHLRKDFGEAFVEDMKALNEATKGAQYDTTYYIDKIEEYKKL